MFYWAYLLLWCIFSGNASDYYQTTVPYTQYQATAAYNDPQWAAAAVRYGPGGIISKNC